ncbi:prepilin peptidase [Vibrio sp. S4M6]|uniref:A24 family peptidase n=1 Tax=Vibrio sinus TaxID=2946865 RepID=UPI002029CC91|nr:prepilin peptidase [Vibrio sinus]MCL9780817.1 prepilin peptidase [Vibrio sinus]
MTAWIIAWWLSLATISCYIGYLDLRYRKIPNTLSLIVFLISVVISLHIKNGGNIMYVAMIFLVGFVLFLFNIIAAGDIKLLCSFFVAISPTYSPMVLFVITFLGGIMGCIQLIWLKANKKNLKESSGVPYGIPICIGCLLGIAASII